VIPEPGAPDHLATIRVVGERAADEEDRVLAAAIPERHTTRAPFVTRQVPGELIDRLAADAAGYGVWTENVSREDAELVTVFLLDRAEEAEQSDPAYRAELEVWLGQRTEQPPAVVPHDAPPPAVERPAVLLLGTMDDDRAAWVQSGRALGRVLLRLTAAGLAASPLTQALDWPATRTRLRMELSLVGHPQMLLRMGWPSAQATETGRRPVSEVLRTID
jgi:hypothetical protein